MTQSLLRRLLGRTLMLHSLALDNRLLYFILEMLMMNIYVLSGGASSGLPTAVPLDAPLEPNMVYTLPPPPRNIFYSKEVIDKAQQLHLHPRQEFMRYDLARALFHQSKPKEQGVFSKLKKLGSKRC